LDRDDSRIPEEIRDSLRNDKIIVVGAGGIGAWFTINVALSSNMEGATLMVCDGDTIEATNLGRLPYPMSWVGKNKAEALREFINEFMERADRMIVAFPNHLNVSMLKDLHPTVIVDCCDNQIVQEQVKEYVRNCRSSRGEVEYIRLAGDSGFVTVTTSDEESYAGINGNGYLVVPSYAGNVMLPAILGFQALVQHREVDINHKPIDEYLQSEDPPNEKNYIDAIKGVVHDGQEA
jgi:molybdopterin/thiamine biosynthesis adenylyltransferase